MTKEEQRSYKLFANRSRDKEERKDTRLFDYVRRSGEAYNERKILKELYGRKGKNPFYRLKNRLLTEVGKSMSLHHSGTDEHQEFFHFFSLSLLYRKKHESEVAEYYLKRAEKKAGEMDYLEGLDMVYGEYISLSFIHKGLNPVHYIQLREENRTTLNQLREIDNILAAVSYRIRISQNFAGRDRDIIELLQRTLDEFLENEKLRENPQFRFRVYEAVSKVLLQNQDYTSLEAFVLRTYNEFLEDKLFSRSNHDIRLQMLTYIINSLYKNEKYTESLAWAEKLREAMSLFNKSLYEKYLFFYYNSLATNYFETDVEKAISILEEMLEIREIVRVPLYEVFISMNLSVFSLKQKDYSAALKRVVRLQILDAWEAIDAAMKLKIAVFELLVRYDLEDLETLEYRLGQVQKDFEELLEEENFATDQGLLTLLKRMMFIPNPRTDEKLREDVLEFLEGYEQTEADFIPLDVWLGEKFRLDLGTKG